MPSTCKSAGSYDEVIKCTECGEELSRTEKSVEKLTTHNYVDNICTVCGKTVASGEGLKFTLDSARESYSVTGIGTCTDLDVIIPETYNGLPVTSIGNYAFKDCTSLTSVTIGNGVASIGGDVFHGCASLKSVTIGNGVTSIGAYAFYGCTSLTTITIPDSVTSIGDFAFTGCTRLAYNEYDNAYYLGNENNPYVVLKTAKSTDIASCEIHNDTKIIYNSAFEDCTSLTSVTRHDSVTSIGNYVFRGCTSLMSITIPDRVTSIGKYAFYGCTALEEIYFNAVAMNDLSYNNYAFNNAGKRGGGIKVVIGKNVTKIPACLFHPSSPSYAPIIVSVEFEEGSICESIGNYAFNNCTSLKSVTIPDSVTSIGSSAFNNCTSLMSVTIPDSVTSIDTYAFYSCTSLKTITIPDRVTSIGENTFAYCTSLTSVTIGNGVASIGNSAFYGCTRLTSITIGNAVTSIGARAFEDCTRLTRVYYGGTADEWSNIDIGLYNSNLTSATRYYYSESDPSSEGSYWHYGESGNIEVW